MKANSVLRLLFAAYMAGGNATILANLQEEIGDRKDVDAEFVPIEMDAESKRIRSRGERGRRSLVPGTFRNSLMTHRRIQELEEVGPKFEAAWFFQQTICMFLPGFRSRVPYTIALDGTPLWYARNGLTYAHPEFDPDTLVERGKHWLTRRVYQQAFHVLPLSNGVHDSLVEDYGVPPERITVVPPGVNLKRFEGPDRTARAETGKPLNVLFVGADFERKGGDLVARLALAPEFRDVEFHFVTRSYVGPAADNIHVHRDVRTNTDELAGLYRDADVFALPTLQDSYSIASIEAMAAGLPVLTTPTGGIVDIVGEGVTGYLVPRDDVSALAERLRTLRDDPALRLRLGAAGRVRAEERFDSAVISARTLALLRDAAASRA